MNTSLPIPLALAVLASAAPAQTLQLSDLVAGERAVVELDHLKPGTRGFLRWRVGSSPNGPQSPGRIPLSPDGAGKARVTFLVPQGLTNQSLVTEAILFAGPGTFVQLRAGALVQAPGSTTQTAGDSFLGTQLDPAWSLLHPELMTHQVQGGALHITPTQSGGAATWFNDGEGPFIYKTIAGDFDARATVHTESSINPGTPVPLQFRLGGLMVRDSASAPGARNSAHIAIGSGSGSFPLAVEDKTTVGSSSDFFFHSIPSQDLSLRITRTGDLVSRYYRIPSASLWTLMRADEHPEFAQDVQVGMMAYSFSSPVDIRATFDGIQFH